MYFINEHNELQESATLLKDLQLDDIDVPGKEDLEKELGNYYISALKKDDMLSAFVSSSDMKGFIGGFNPLAIGKKILEKVRKAVCAVIKEGSTVGEITDAVLQVIAGIIPGGGIVKVIVQKVVKFIVGKGVGAFCKV